VQYLVLLLIGAFVVGATRFGRWVRAHPPALAAFAVIAAAGFYSLRVIQ
jgi:hypothetical protein